MLISSAMQDILLLQRARKFLHAIMLLNKSLIKVVGGSMVLDVADVNGKNKWYTDHVVVLFSMLPSFQQSDLKY